MYVYTINARNMLCAESESYNIFHDLAFQIDIWCVEGYVIPRLNRGLNSAAAARGSITEYTLVGIQFYVTIIGLMR